MIMIIEVIKNRDRYNVPPKLQ